MMMEPANGKSDGKPTSIHHSHCHCRKAQQSLSLVLLRKLGKKGPQCSLCFRSMKLLQTDTLTYLKLVMAKHPTHRKASSKHNTTNSTRSQQAKALYGTAAKTQTTNTRQALTEVCLKKIHPSRSQSVV